MLAKDIMSRGVVSVRSNSSVLEAATLLVNTKAGAMTVLNEEDVLVGIVTDADLIKYADLDAVTNASVVNSQVRDAEFGARRLDEMKNRRVSDIMTKNVSLIDEDASLKEVVDVMVRRRLKRLPVLGGESIIGIISRVDLLRAIISQAHAPEPAAGSDRQTDDAEVRRQVLEAFRGKLGSLARDLEVVAIGGTVHLWGSVPNEDVYQDYRDAVRRIPGVKGVMFHMHVLPAGAWRVRST